MKVSRVLHVVGGMDVGGQETFIMNLYRNIDRSKIQFDFLVHTANRCFYDNEIKSLGGRIFNVKPKSKNIIKHIQQTNQLLKNINDYKAIHIHTCMATDFLEAFIAHKNGWEKVIMHSHSTQGTRGRAGKYIHYICRPLNSHFSTHKFACSIDAGIWLYGKGNRKNITIVKNGIDVNKYLFDKKIRINLRKDLKLKDSFTIGHIGRFSDVKNHEFLIEIFKNINNRIPKTKLILVGDGELKPKIEEKVFALGLNNNVIFTGIRDDIEKILQALDLFILPSKYEGMPGVAIEAQASGLNCIISDTVTKDVSVTSLVEFKSIKESSELWANYIIEKYIQNTLEIDRHSPISNIINAGYDINERARWFEQIYLE